MDAAWLVGLAAGAGFGVVAWRMEYLTGSGAVAGGLFGASLVGLGGWEWIAPALTFFLLSSALSRWATESKGAYAEASAREGRRDASQVLANGGVAWLLLLVHALAPQELLYWGFVASLAAAAADTWASEVGPVFRQQPRMILSGRPVPAGTSGAVSWAGTLAGVLGALVIWATAWWTAPDAVRSVGLAASLLAVAGGGTLGSLVDSLAGATIEAVYPDPRTGHLVHDPPAGIETAPARGWRPVNNEVVNALCTTIGAAAAILLLLVFLD